MIFPTDKNNSLQDAHHSLFFYIFAPVALSYCLQLHAALRLSAERQDGRKP